MVDTVSTPCVGESATESIIRYLIEMQPSVGSALQKAASQPALLLTFFFLFRGGRTRKLSEDGRGGFAGDAVNPLRGPAQPLAA
ncbi:hypothetical protein, partial [Stenotrophomonas sp. GD04024]|uniref:hypothetical protein n=1 Tax=Stenotrophomonas sp. GD04024 TaxID=2975422 RepID=UPI002447BEF5